jgi:single-strand DNA-binding protein
MSTARSLNKVMLIGNLTRPPALKKTTNGAVVATFGIATNSTWKDADGNLQERAEFHNIVAWNKLAEICAQILNTGMLVWVEGELRTRAWDDGEMGKKQYRTEIKIEDMKLLDAKDKNGVGVDDAYAEDVVEDEIPSDTPLETEEPKSSSKEADDLF